MEVEKAEKKHPDTGPQHHANDDDKLKDQVGSGGMDKGHNLLKGHHEESDDGKPKANTHSGVNPQAAKEDERREEQTKEDIAAVKASEEVVKDNKGNEQAHAESHTTHKKNLDDTVYNFVK